MVWPPSMSTSWAKPAVRRATILTPSALAAALEQGRVADVGPAGHRVGEVGGAVDEVDHGLAVELAGLGEGGDVALGPADDGAGDVELGREHVAAGDDELG